MSFNSFSDFLAEGIGILGFSFTFVCGVLLAVLAYERLSKHLRRNRGELVRQSPVEFFGESLEIELDCGQKFKPVRIAQIPQRVELTESLHGLPELLPIIDQNQQRHFFPMEKVKRISRL